MSNILRTFLRLLPVTVSGLLFNIVIIGRFNVGIYVLVNLVTSFFVLCFVAAFLATLFKDRKLYKQTRSKLSFLPTVIGIIFIVSFFITYIVVAARDKSPVLIKAIYVEDFYGSGFEFREDGSYKFTDIGG